MFGIGSSEIMLIIAAGLVIFGIKRLPEIGTSLGKGLRNFRKNLEGREEETSVSCDTTGDKQAK